MKVYRELEQHLTADTFSKCDDCNVRIKTARGKSRSAAQQLEAIDKFSK